MIEWKIVWSIYATIAIPLLYLCTIFLAYTYPHTFALPWLLQTFGFFLAIFGIVIWILSYYYLGASFGILPKKQKRVTRGLYTYINHPMYIGIWSTFVGLSLAHTSLPGLLFTTLIITPLLFIRAAVEDKQLSV